MLRAWMKGWMNASYFWRDNNISIPGAPESILRGWRNSPLIPVKVTDEAAGVKQWDKEPV